MNQRCILQLETLQRKMTHSRRKATEPFRKPIVSTRSAITKHPSPIKQCGYIYTLVKTVRCNSCARTEVFRPPLCVCRAERLARLCRPTWRAREGASFAFCPRAGCIDRRPSFHESHSEYKPRLSSASSS